MAQTILEDLPDTETLTPEEMAALFGAGRKYSERTLRTLRFETLDGRQMMAADLAMTSFHVPEMAESLESVIHELAAVESVQQSSLSSGAERISEPLDGSLADIAFQEEPLVSTTSSAPHELSQIKTLENGNRVLTRSTNGQETFRAEYSSNGTLLSIRTNKGDVRYELDFVDGKPSELRSNVNGIELLRKVWNSDGTLQQETRRTREGQLASITTWTGVVREHTEYGETGAERSQTFRNDVLIEETYKSRGQLVSLTKWDHQGRMVYQEVTSHGVKQHTVIKFAGNVRDEVTFQDNVKVLHEQFHLQSPLRDELNRQKAADPTVNVAELEQKIVETERIPVLREVFEIQSRRLVFSEARSWTLALRNPKITSRVPSNLKVVEGTRTVGNYSLSGSVVEVFQAGGAHPAERRLYSDASAKQLIQADTFSASGDLEVRVVYGSNEYQQTTFQKVGTTQKPLVSKYFVKSALQQEESFDTAGELQKRRIWTSTGFTVEKFDSGVRVALEAYSSDETTLLQSDKWNSKGHHLETVIYGKSESQVTKYRRSGDRDIRDSVSYYADSRLQQKETFDRDEKLTLREIYSWNGKVSTVVLKEEIVGSTRTVTSNTSNGTLIQTLVNGKETLRETFHQGKKTQEATFYSNGTSKAITVWDFDAKQVVSVNYSTKGLRTSRNIHSFTKSNASDLTLQVSQTYTVVNGAERPAAMKIYDADGKTISHSVTWTYSGDDVTKVTRDYEDGKLSQQRVWLNEQPVSYHLWFYREARTVTRNLLFNKKISYEIPAATIAIIEKHYDDGRLARHIERDPDGTVVMDHQWTWIEFATLKNFKPRIERKWSQVKWDGESAWSKAQVGESMEFASSDENNMSLWGGGTSVSAPSWEDVEDEGKAFNDAVVKGVEDLGELGTDTYKSLEEGAKQLREKALQKVESAGKELAAKQKLVRGTVKQRIAAVKSILEDVRSVVKQVETTGIRLGKDLEMLRSHGEHFKQNALDAKSLGTDALKKGQQIGKSLQALQANLPSPKTIQTILTQTPTTAIVSAVQQRIPSVESIKKGALQEIDAVKTQGSDAWDSAKQEADHAIEEGRQVGTAFAAAAKDTGGAVANTIKDAGGAVAEAAKDAGGEIAKGAKEVGSQIAQLLKSLYGIAVPGDFERVVTDFANATVSLVKAPVQAGVSFVESLKALQATDWNTLTGPPESGLSLQGISNPFQHITAEELLNVAGMINFNTALSLVDLNVDISNEGGGWWKIGAKVAPYQFTFSFQVNDALIPNGDWRASAGYSVGSTVSSLGITGKFDSEKAVQLGMQARLGDFLISAGIEGTVGSASSTFERLLDDVQTKVTYEYQGGAKNNGVTAEAAGALHTETGTYSPQSVSLKGIDNLLPSVQLETLEKLKRWGGIVEPGLDVVAKYDPTKGSYADSAAWYFMIGASIGNDKVRLQAAVDAQSQKTVITATGESDGIRVSAQGDTETGQTTNASVTAGDDVKVGVSGDPTTGEHQIGVSASNDNLGVQADFDPSKGQVTGGSVEVKGQGEVVDGVHVGGATTIAVDGDGSITSIDATTKMDIGDNSDIPLGIGREPLVVFIGGMLDSVHKLHEKVHGDFTLPDGQKKYFEWTEEDRVVGTILQHLAKNPFAPIVLVGHSYGGDTALDVAASLNRIGGITVQLVVTLDPVSRFDFEGQLGTLKSPNIEKWKNIWVDPVQTEGNLLPDRNSDIVAKAGGHWYGGVDGADNEKTTVSHGNAAAMFALAADQVLQVAAGQTIRSEDQLTAIKRFLDPNSSLHVGGM